MSCFLVDTQLLLWSTSAFGRLPTVLVTTGRLGRYPGTIEVV